MKAPQFLSKEKIEQLVKRPGVLAAWPVLTLLTCTSTLAFENFPEFQSLTETEQAAFEGPELLNPEYSGVLLGYQKPPEWQYSWLENKRALDLSFGSLNTRRFMMDQRLKIHHPLSSAVEFRFTYFDEGDLERQSTHAILEFVFWPWSKLGLSLYGEPSFRKVNDDTGIAVVFKPADRHEIRVFNTFIDVTRLKYPDGFDTHVEPELPEARGLVGRVTTEPLHGTPYGDFLEYSARYETRTRWLFSAAGYEYLYWKWYASLYGRKQFSKDFSGALRLETDRKHESRERENSTTDRFTSFLESTLHSLGPSSTGTAGISLANRRWDTDSGFGTYTDVTPYVRFNLSHWLLSYLLIFHDETGLASKDGDTTEHRFQIAYEFVFDGTGKLILLAAADIDKLFTARSWGGGSGQFQLFF